MRLLLVIPNSRWYGRRFWLGPQQSALILAGIIGDKHKLIILDANNENLSEDETKWRIKNTAKDWVMVSGMLTEQWRHYHSIAAMDRGNSKFVMGGIYANLMDEDIVKDKNVDYVFVGHAEHRLIPFLENPGKETIYRECIRPRRCIDLVDPDYSLFPIDKYFGKDSDNYRINAGEPIAQMITSYGCPHSCYFCAAREISGYGISFRTSESVINEVRNLRNHGVRRFSSVDDCMFANRNRIVEICEGFSKLDIEWRANNVSAWHLDKELIGLLKKCGVALIVISVESGCERVLKDIIHKPIQLEKIGPIVEWCKEAGILISSNFVIGNVGETWSEIRETIRFAEAMDFDLVNFHIATPLPKTEIYRVAKEKGYLPEDFSFYDERFFGFAKGYITTPEFTPEDLQILRCYEWDRINFSTLDKQRRVCRVLGMNDQQIAEHRKQSRLTLGKYYVR